MKQPKLMSFLESAVNIIVGLGVAMLANAIILPLLGFDVSLAQNAIIAAFMTVVSLIRSYGLRRLFEALHIRVPISAFASAVLAERQRQQYVEGWSPEHDDRHEEGEMASAGNAYIGCAGVAPEENRVPPGEWPWEPSWWKPTGFRRDLVKGCALVIAEGERHDRNRRRKPLVTDDASNNHSARIDPFLSLQQKGKG